MICLLSYLSYRDNIERSYRGSIDSIIEIEINNPLNFCLISFFLLL